jgi:hypothetical protein
LNRFSGNENLIMRHFSLENWADFANQKVSVEERTSMKRHLEMGCSQCSHVIAEWQSLKRFAVQESQNDPPGDVVAFVKSAFKIQRLRCAPGIVEALAELVFDSIWQPALAEVRSGSVDSRFLLYKAGPVLIDLHLNLTESSGHIALQGQVMDSEKEPKGIEEILVLLQSGQETIARTQTNEFGEFQLECDARKSLQMSVAVNPQKNVLIVLDETVWTTHQGANAPQ